jgi:hypothetical protein
MTMWTAPAGGSTKSQLEARALSLSNFPTGWSVDNAPRPAEDQGCLSGLKKISKHETKVSVSFTDGGLPEVDEVLSSGPGSAPRYNELVKALNACNKPYTVTSGTVTGKVSVGAMSFPTVGQRSTAFALTLTVQGVNAGADLVLFQVGSVSGAVDYEDLGQPDPAVAPAPLGGAAPGRDRLDN